MFFQNSSEIAIEDDKAISCARYQRRLQLMLRALLAVIGDALRNSFLTQQLLVKVRFNYIYIYSVQDHCNYCEKIAK